MISLEEFKKIIEQETGPLTDHELEVAYRIHMAFANFTYKKWIESKSSR